MIGGQDLIVAEDVNEDCIESDLTLLRQRFAENGGLDDDCDLGER
jgi:hypothetical protein